MNSKNIQVEIEASETRLQEVQAQAATAANELVTARKAFAKKRITDTALFQVQSRSSALAGVVADLESEISDGENALAAALADENRARIESELAELSSAAKENHAEMHAAWEKAVADLAESVAAIQRHIAREDVARLRCTNLANELGEPHRLNGFESAVNGPLGCDNAPMFRYVVEAVVRVRMLDSRDLAEIAA